MTRILDAVRRLFATPFWRWMPAVAVVAFAGVVRFWDLARVPAFLFDERYYVPQALSLAKLGYEATWTGYISDAGTFNPADVAQVAGNPTFTTHGPLTKWILWLGMSVFGVDNPVGWRCMPALFGVVLVALVIVVTFQLFRSAAWATLAGCLIAVDNVAVLMSRTAMLDVFLAVFTLAGVSAVLADRARTLTKGRSWWRPWLVAAGALFGLATGVKLVGVVFLVVFVVYALLDAVVSSVKSAGPYWPAVRGGLNAGLTLSVSAVMAWLVSWMSYFLNSGGPGRELAAEAGGLLALVPQPVRALLGYQNFAYFLESQISSTNSNASPAASWPFLLRPVQFYFESAAPAGQTSAATPVVDVLSVGNPVLWWTSIIALFVVAVAALLRRDRTAWLILAGLAAGWGPWLLIGDRTIYQYYAIVFEPYLVIAVVFAAVRWYRGAQARGAAGGMLTVLVAWCAVVGLVSLWLAPLTLGLEMPWSQVQSLLVLPGWR